jgi:hypothetical protein
MADDSSSASDEEPELLRANAPYRDDDLEMEIRIIMYLQTNENEPLSETGQSQYEDLQRLYPEKACLITPKMFSSVIMSNFSIEAIGGMDINAATLDAVKKSRKQEKRRTPQDVQKRSNISS